MKLIKVEDKSFMDKARELKADFIVKAPLIERIVRGNKNGYYMCFVSDRFCGEFDLVVCYDGKYFKIMGKRVSSNKLFAPSKNHNYYHQELSFIKEVHNKILDYEKGKLFNLLKKPRKLKYRPRKAEDIDEKYKQCAKLVKEKNYKINRAVQEVFNRSAKGNDYLHIKKHMKRKRGRPKGSKNKNV